MNGRQRKSVRKFMRFLPFYACLLCVSVVDKKFTSSMDEIYDVTEHHMEVFDIYYWNGIYRSWGRKEKSLELLELYDWVIKFANPQGKEVPLLTGEGDYGEGYFYEGVVGLDM